MTLYYIFRDKIPFYLSIIWIYRDQIKERVGGLPLDLLGQYLITVTWFLEIGCLWLLFTGESLMKLVGFTWSFPSPLQWGFLVLLLTRSLEKKGVGIFESYYLALLTGIGGGFIWEVLYGLPYWIESGFAYWNFVNFSPVKIFFIDFQVFALPIVYYSLRKRFNFRIKESWKILSVLVAGFYLFGFEIAPFFHRMGNYGGNGVYGWVLRIPVVILLYVMVNGVEKNEMRVL